MDMRSGNIYRANEIEKFDDLSEGIRKRLVPLTEEEANQMAPMSKNQRKNNMRNKPCICGRTKKFKKCCWNKYL